MNKSTRSVIFRSFRNFPNENKQVLSTFCYVSQFSQHILLLPHHHNMALSQSRRDTSEDASFTNLSFDLTSGCFQHQPADEEESKVNVSASDLRKITFFSFSVPTKQGVNVPCVFPLEVVAGRATVRDLFVKVFGPRCDPPVTATSLTAELLQRSLCIANSKDDDRVELLHSTAANDSNLFFSIDLDVMTDEAEVPVVKALIAMLTKEDLSHELSSVLPYSAHCSDSAKAIKADRATTITDVEDPGNEKSYDSFSPGSPRPPLGPFQGFTRPPLGAFKGFDGGCPPGTQMT